MEIILPPSQSPCGVKWAFDCQEPGTGPRLAQRLCYYWGLVLVCRSFPVPFTWNVPFLPSVSLSWLIPTGLGCHLLHEAALLPWLAYPLCCALEMPKIVMCSLHWVISVPDSPLHEEGLGSFSATTVSLCVSQDQPHNKCWVNKGNKWMEKASIEWKNSWMREWIVGWIGGGTDECKNRWIKEWIGGWMVGGKGWMNKWMDGWMDRWIDDRWIDEWVSGWMDEWMDGWVKRCWFDRQRAVLQAVGSAGGGTSTNVWPRAWQFRPEESTSCPCPGWGVCTTLISTMQLSANTLHSGRQILESQTPLPSLTRKRVTGSCHLPVASFRILEFASPKAYGPIFLFSLYM